MNARSLSWMVRTLATEKGAGLAEYGLVTLLIAIVALIGVAAAGGETSEMYSTIADGVSAAGS